MKNGAHCALFFLFVVYCYCVMCNIFFCFGLLFCVDFIEGVLLVVGVVLLFIEIGYFVWWYNVLLINFWFIVLLFLNCVKFVGSVYGIVWMFCCFFVDSGWCILI